MKVVYKKEKPTAMIELIGFPKPFWYRSSTFGAAYKIREIDNHVEVEMNLPGIEKKDVELKYSSYNFTLQVSIKDLQDKDILIAHQIDYDNIKAELKLGVLKVRMPIKNIDKTIQIE